MIAYEAYTDQELLELLKKSDQAAFTEIYDRYKLLLHRYAYRWLQEKEAVKDVIQELFTVLWTRREALVLNENLSGYLYVSVRNGILRKISQDKRFAAYAASLADYADKGESITDHRLRENQLRAIIEKEIATLPSKMREVFELSRNSHLSHTEIAERLNLSEHTVRTHIKKALKILRSRLGFYLLIYFFMG
ncbi:RNA polymerase sigma-70 factor (family 1) [Pedobacter africanus]|uniref:RNA polymerase sigma-70 factor (ECF subfamily) n=1 Tax=Pedobacter africanus TaxID=151894 RepID=A0ACC6KVS4_9SPHI|nr:RNA polymerase sigma-70 factor [Pedobacter africanus]MDR6783183.1 RNA polymerase sigma-70 factor (ECF subfamily) [Pedobacter africanus]